MKRPWRQSRSRRRRRGKDVDYLRRLVETIRPLLTRADRYREITIYLADSPRCDARSLPGGTLVFFQGLLNSAESEAALVGVVGHELSHLEHNHPLVQIGYDPREMVRVITKIGERETNQPLVMPSIFRSHPPADERRKAVLDLYEELQKGNPNEHLYIGKENIRRRIARSQREYAL